jgi:hypothetical protein
MIVMVMFDKKYCNNNSNNRCTFIIVELPVSVHDFTDHIYDHNIDNDITEYVNEEAQTEHEKQLHLRTSPDILDRGGM